MTTNGLTLFHASRQWSTRPADERFASVQALHDACAGYRSVAVEKLVPYSQLIVEPNGDEVMLKGPQGGSAQLSHWAFGQLCQRAEAPASYLRELPAELAARNLQHGLSQRATNEQAQLMFHRNGGLLARAITSTDYARIWNSDITQRLLAMEARGPWQPAPAAFDGSRGLYASDHDMFAFMVDSDRRIFETGPGGGLSRGFFAWNSEVGAASFGVMTFLYEYVCGNHRVWGASAVRELRVRHVGDANRRMSAFVGELRAYAEGSAADDELRIRKARTVLLGDDKDAVLDRVFRMRIPVLSRKAITEAYDRAALPESVERYGDPRTAWGFTGGLTEMARDLPYADERVTMDRAAGKVLEVVF